MITNVLLAIIAIEVGALVYLLYQPIDIPDNTESNEKADSKLNRILQFEDRIYDMVVDMKSKVTQLSEKKKSRRAKSEDNKNV